MTHPGILTIGVPTCIVTGTVGGIACGGSTNLNDNKCSSLPSDRVTLFPDEGQYDNWKEIADKWGFEISKDCENWFKDGSIDKGDDIADYYLNKIQSGYLENLFVEKIDPHWNQEEYDSIFNRPKDYISDIRTGRNPFKNDK